MGHARQLSSVSFENYYLASLSSLACGEKMWTEALLFEARQFSGHEQAEVKKYKIKSEAARKTNEVLMKAKLKPLKVRWQLKPSLERRE